MIWRVTWHEPVVGDNAKPGSWSEDHKERKRVRFEYRPCHQNFDTADEAREFRWDKREEGHKGKIEINVVDEQYEEEERIRERDLRFWMEEEKYR